MINDPKLTGGLKTDERGQKTEVRRRMTDYFEFGLRPIGACAPEGSGNAECALSFDF